MPTAFSRSIHALELDGRRSRVVVLAIAAVLLTAWAVWFLESRVTVYAVSEQARLEVDRATYPVQATVAGRVTMIALEVGSKVQVGDPLVELDMRAQALRAGEERARIGGLAPQRERLNAEIAEHQQAREDDRQTAAAAREEAQARYDEANARADLATDTERRIAGLAKKELVSKADVARAEAETKQHRAGAETLRLSIQRLDAEQRRKDTDEQIQIARLQREAADLRAQAGTGAATLARLEHEGELRRITAPIAGTLAEVSPVRLGGVLQEGDKVATIVPAGDLRIVAQFLPATALGRVRVGQHARLRLDGFPWTQYGSVTATVTSVASEVRDSRVRVELAVAAGQSASLQLQHGLPGTVEVEVERVSPAALVLRAAGKRLSPAASEIASPSHP
jgi:membrane fusion protein (multidrug efflux system)